MVSRKNGIKSVKRVRAKRRRTKQNERDNGIFRCHRRKEKKGGG
nr:MAG TPA: hypothetical protein [Caudoviricetes sp.]